MKTSWLYSDFQLSRQQIIYAARVIDAYEAKEGLQRQLADRFKVSKSFVQRLLCHYRHTKQLTPKPHKGGAIALDRSGRVVNSAAIGG